MVEFNPKKNEKVVISIRIPKEIVDTVDNLSNETDISRNEFIVQCIEFAIQNYKHNDN